MIETLLGGLFRALPEFLNFFDKNREGRSSTD